MCSSRLTAVLLSCLCLWSTVWQIQARYGNALLSGADWHAPLATMRAHTRQTAGLAAYLDDQTHVSQEVVQAVDACSCTPLL